MIYFKYTNIVILYVDKRQWEYRPCIGYQIKLVISEYIYLFLLQNYSGNLVYYTFIMCKNPHSILYISSNIRFIWRLLRRHYESLYITSISNTCVVLSLLTARYIKRVVTIFNSRIEDQTSWTVLQKKILIKLVIEIK